MSLHGPGIQNSRFHGPLSPLVKVLPSPFFCTWGLLVPLLRPSCPTSSSFTLGEPWPPPTLPLVQGLAHVPSDAGSIHLTQRSSQQQRSWALSPQFCSPAATILVPLGTWSLCPANGLKTTRLGKRHLQCLSPGKLGSLKQNYGNESVIL